MQNLETQRFCNVELYLLKGEFSQNIGTNIDSINKTAIRITAGITPFNFPAMVPMWMFPISIACGNSFIQAL